MSNIIEETQQPVVVEIKDLVTRFGSHYEVLNDKNSTNQVNLTIFEKIGPTDKLNTWEHEHVTLSEAIEHVNSAIHSAAEQRITRFKKESSTLAGQIVLFRHRFGLVDKEAKSRLDNYVQLHKEDLNDVEHFSQASERDVKFLEGTCRIPKYMPAPDTDYFLVNLNKLPELSITTVRLNEVDIYDHFNSRSSDTVLNDYDIHFTHRFLEVGNPEGVWEVLQFENLARYNGVFYNLSSSHNFLFSTKEQALEFVSKQIQYRLEKHQKIIKELHDTQLKIQQN